MEVHRPRSAGSSYSAGRTTRPSGNGLEQRSMSGDTECLLSGGMLEKCLRMAPMGIALPGQSGS